MSKQENLRKVLESAFPGMGMGSDAATVERLTRENERQKVQIAELQKTVAVLRESKNFYQENYRKAKAAYERVVAERKAE